MAEQTLRAEGGDLQQCAICQQLLDSQQCRLVTLAHLEVVVCSGCVVAGPAVCAEVVREQAETALVLGRELHRLMDWPAQ